jgi:hypothetical protein
LVTALPRGLVWQCEPLHSWGLHEMTMYAQHYEVRNIMLDDGITILRTWVQLSFAVQLQNNKTKCIRVSTSFISHKMSLGFTTSMLNKSSINKVKCQGSSCVNDQGQHSITKSNKYPKSLSTNYLIN